jgi:hypothetical protein
MQPIQYEQLSTVVGGFGALLQAAGPILNGVANIIGASKSGGGGGAASAPPPPPPAAAAAALPPAPTPVSSDPTVSVSVSINGVPR